MYVGRDFAPAEPGENEIYTFDFANDLGDGEKLSIVVWTATLVSGVDPNTAAHISGTSSLDDTGTKSSQRVAGLIGGCLYRLEAVAITDAGNTKILHSRVRCISPT